LRILVVEDERVFREALCDLLEGAGHDVAWTGDGADAVRKVAGATFDAVVLDVMLPSLDGIAACRKLRESGHEVPVVLLTALGAEDDKVRGLEAGADDFVTKPFGARELLARLEAVVRRARPTGTREHLEADGCVLDLGRCRTVRGGDETVLTAREADVLRWLYRHRGTAVSRADLLQHVWHVPGHLRTRAVDMAISTLRQKIERDPAAPRIVVSVKGVGYAWGPAD
jgi:DNA-binding response OmpR family regulator